MIKVLKYNEENLRPWMKDAVHLEDQKVVDRLLPAIYREH